MYKKFILKFVAFDSMLGICWIIFGVWLIWMGIKNISKATNPKLFFSVSAMFVLTGLFFFYSIRMRLFDYLEYLRAGDSYVESKTCKVVDTTWTTLPFIMFGNEDIKCDDGKWYYIRYQRTYRWTGKKGKTFKIIFLPESKVIIEMQKLLEQPGRKKPRVQGD